MRHDFSPALIALLDFSIVAAKISLYTSSRFLGYSPPFLKNLLVKGIPDGERFFQAGTSQCSLFAPIAHSSPENLLTCHLIYHQALDFLRWLTPFRHRDLIIGRLVELLPILNEIVVSEVADHLLHVAFHWEEFDLPPQVAREHLNAEQHAVLHAIAARDHLLVVEQESQNQEIWSGIRQDLHFLDLPTTQQGLQAFLALVTPQESEDLSEG